MNNTKSSVLNALSTAKFWKELVIMTLGMMVAAIAVNPFRMVVIGIIGTFIKDNGIKAFTTAGNVSEIYGLWFKNGRH